MIHVYAGILAEVGVDVFRRFATSSPSFFCTMKVLWFLCILHGEVLTLRCVMTIAVETIPVCRCMLSLKGGIHHLGGPILSL